MPPRLRERLARPFVIESILATLVVASLLESLFTVGRPFSWPIFGLLVLACYGAARLVETILPPSTLPWWRRDGDD